MTATKKHSQSQSQKPKQKRARRWICDVCGYIALNEKEKFHHMDEKINDPLHLALNTLPPAFLDSSDVQVRSSRLNGAEDHDDADMDILPGSDDHEPWNA